MEPNFNEIKQEILRRAKKASACKHEYGRAYAAETISELSQVIKENFDWACDHGVLTVDLIEQYKEDFSANDIYANRNVKSGYLLCSNATVEAYGNTTVRAYENAVVEVYGNAKVEACENAVVVAHGNAAVVAYDNATIKACDNATVLAWDSATVEAHDYTKVDVYDTTTVEAYGNAYCTSYCPSFCTIDCKLSDNAIYRDRSTNTIYYANPDIKFVKQ